MKQKLNKQQLLFLVAVFITNIGNGMFTLAISKLLYDKTNSIFSFGIVIIIENILSFLLQFISGYISDIKNPKKISFYSDLIRGAIILIFTILFFQKEDIFIIGIMLFIINIINPFYKVANFKLVPHISKGEEKLYFFNSCVGVLFQIGQLIGIGLVPIILNKWNIHTAFFINSLSFFISGFILKKIKIDNNFYIKKINNKEIKNIFFEWIKILKKIYFEKDYILHLFLSSGDYISINFINLIIVPLALNKFNNILYASYFDASFAIGASLSIFLIGYFIKIKSKNIYFSIGLFIQSIMYLILSTIKTYQIVIMIFFIIGIFNSISVAIYQTTLQNRTSIEYRGRIGSLKNLFISLTSLILIPIASNIYDSSMIRGMHFSSGIILIYSILSFIFGEYYFKKIGSLSRVGVEKVR